MRQRSNSRQRTVREGAVVSSSLREGHGPRWTIRLVSVVVLRIRLTRPLQMQCAVPRILGGPSVTGGRDDVQALAVRLGLQTGGR